MTVDDFRRLALALEGTVEGSHMGHPDFRVQNRIFATLPPGGSEYGVLLLNPEQQSGLVEDAPDLFSPVPGGWGRNGSTRVHLEKITDELLAGALRLAWQNRVAKNAGKKSATVKKTALKRKRV